jgi:hypothetical protein
MLRVIRYEGEQTHVRGQQQFSTNHAQLQSIFRYLNLRTVYKSKVPKGQNFFKQTIANVSLLQNGSSTFFRKSMLW